MSKLVVGSVIITAIEVVGLTAWIYLWPDHKVDSTVVLFGVLLVEHYKALALGAK